MKWFRNQKREKEKDSEGRRWRQRKDTKGKETEREKTHSAKMAKQKGKNVDQKDHTPLLTLLAKQSSDVGRE